MVQILMKELETYVNEYGIIDQQTKKLFEFIRNGMK
jgi:hypothetical protein